MNFAERELEIKFVTDAEGLSAAWNSPLLAGDAPQAAARILKSTYYDTAEGDLTRQGMTLRLRRAGRGAPTLAFKWIAPSAEGPFTRGEIEARHPASGLDVNLLGEFVAAELSKATAGRPLEPQFETRFKRRVRRMKIGAAEVEAAFDEGQIVAGDRVAPLTELELELTAGEPADFYDFATEVAERLPLRLEILSKSRRGFLLRADARPYPVKAGETRIPPEASFDDAAAVVIGDTLQHFLANWPALRDGDNPEAIHQLRVALRRMRALLGLLQREAPCGEFTAFRDEAKRIASALGPARECDAFAELIAAGPREAFGEHPAFAALDKMIAARRAALHEEARGLIAAPACAQFVLQLQAFLARRGWRNALSAEQLPRLTQPARAFAVASLDRLRRRALARGKKLAQMPDAQRHELRIALKKLRYAAEAFGDLFGPIQERRGFLRSISRLQDLFGTHNDAASARAFLDDIRAAERPETAFAAGATLGWFAGRAAGADHELLQAWKAFKAAETFWE